jgi:hypothetical protein
VAAQRCALCGISYPTMSSFQTCPIHGDETQYLQNADPSPDWKKQMERLVAQMERANELGQRVPLARGVETFYDPVTGPNVLFVDQGELGRAGVRLSRMQPDQFHLFQLEDGWIYETQGWDDSHRRWWVERVIRTEGDTSPRTTPGAAHSSTESATG